MVDPALLTLGPVIDVGPAGCAGQGPETYPQRLSKTRLTAAPTR